METKKLKSTILGKISQEEIKPIPKELFILKNRIFWLTTILLLIVWTVFWAFLLNDSQDYLTYWNHVWFSIMFFVPHLLWLLFLSVIIFLWIREYRNTRMWYKISFKMLFTIVLLIISIWTILFYISWLWQYIHNNLISKTPINKYIYDFSLWNSPESWRIAWEIVEIDSNIIKIKDTDWKKWEIEIKDAFISPIIEMRKWEKIRIFWKVISQKLFKADKIAPEVWRWGVWWKWMWRWKWIHFFNR